MDNRTDRYKICTNNALPAKGKILISAPFLRNELYKRSVILLIEHKDEGSMGIIMNKELPLTVKDVVKEFEGLDDIPLYMGGPAGEDILFYLHTLPGLKGSTNLGKGLYLNGDFEEIKRYVLQGNPTKGNIRFFLGCSCWQYGKLEDEIEGNIWMIGRGERAELMNGSIKSMWRNALVSLGGKYETWSRFPLVSSLN